MEELNRAVETARDMLSSGRVPNERALEHTVVLPVLRSLGWNSADIDQLWPEYSAGRGRVDWALCDNGEPRVFLEEKAPDQNLGSHEQQLLQYAFEQGVALAVLTNGIEWWLYLPLEEGQWAARRFASVDLVQQDVQESASYLWRYLERGRVVSGEARNEATMSHRRNRERDRIARVLPGLIRDILANPPPFIVEVFQNEAQSDLGALPPDDLTATALRALVGAQAQEVQRASELPAANGPVASVAVQGSKPPPYSTPVAVLVKGKRLPVKRWKDMLVETANWILSEGRTLPVGKVPGSKWVLVSATSKGMKSPYKLSNGCFIETWFSAHDCVKRSQWLMSQAGYSEGDVQAEYLEPQSE